MAQSKYSTNVFINCPFDPQYKPLFESIVFAISACGYRPRCALEIDDASEVRIDKIFRIIEECKFGVHDISRTEPAPKSGLPRFNMPLELGMFLAAKKFGIGRQKKKACLILDSTAYRYQQFISDIAGQNIQVHENEPRKAITTVRNWLRNVQPIGSIPGGADIVRKYEQFEQDLPSLCEEIRVVREDFIFNDLAYIVFKWLNANG